MGPFLFTLYINDIASISSTNPRLFADDTCIALNDKKLENLQTKIRTEVTKISKWLIPNKLTLNLSKSNIMIKDAIKLKQLKNSYSDFTKLANIDMKNVNLVKYLSIIFDKDLSFKFHINNLIKKLSRSVGIIAKARPFLTNSAILKLYYILFHTHLTYGLIVWGSTFKSYVNKLSTLQNRAVNIIGGAKSSDRATPYFSNFNILKLSDLLMFEIATFTYHSKNNLLSLPFQNYFSNPCNVHKQLTRGSTNYNFFLPFRRTRKLQRSIKYQGSKVWNSLSLELKESKSLATLESKLKSTLLQKF